MAAARADVRGGPCDGVWARRRPGVRVGPLRAFIDPDGRVWRSDGPGRALYLLVGGAYLFVGNHLRLCGACGGLTPKAEGGRESAPCSLCGAVKVGRR